jgi:hypothetical protein
MALVAKYKISHKSFKCQLIIHTYVYTVYICIFYIMIFLHLGIYCMYMQIHIYSIYISNLRMGLGGVFMHTFIVPRKKHKLKGGNSNRNDNIKNDSTK